MMHSSYKWVVLFGSFIVYLFDALEISILSFAIPAVSQEFGLEPFQAGLLATATLLGMGVGGPLMGWLADARGRKTALIVCLTIFVVLTSAVALAPSYAVFLVLRFFAGIGLGGVWSILSAFVHEAWPPERRGIAVTFVLSAFPFGALVAAQLSGLLLPDWRLLFLIAGLGGILPLLIIVFLFVESAVWRTDRQKAAAEPGGQETAAIGEIFTGPQLRITIIASCVAALAFISYYGVTTWLPSYLELERGLDAKAVGQYMTWLNLGMFVGYLVFGWLADKVGKRSALVASLLGAGVLMPVYGLVTDQSALLWLGPLYAFFMTFAGLFGPYLGSLYSTRMRATGAGFCFNVGRGISAFAPMIFGAIAAVASLAAGLVISGGLFLIASVLVLFLPKIPNDHNRAQDAPATALQKG
ncbi:MULTISPECIES: MFS transporter [Brevibacterium]|nr:MULTISPECIES: MFS transporter [Brevibacterium]